MQKLRRVKNDTVHTDLCMLNSHALLDDSRGVLRVLMFQHQLTNKAQVLGHNFRVPSKVGI